MAKRGRPRKGAAKSPFFKDASAEAARVEGLHRPKPSSFDPAAFELWIKQIRDAIRRDWMGPFVNFDLACRLEDSGEHHPTGLERQIFSSADLAEFRRQKAEYDRKTEITYKAAKSRQKELGLRGAEGAGVPRTSRVRDIVRKHPEIFEKREIMGLAWCLRKIEKAWKKEDGRLPAISGFYRHFGKKIPTKPFP